MKPIKKIINPNKSKSPGLSRKILKPKETLFQNYYLEKLGIKICPKCNELNGRSSDFCPNCAYIFNNFVAV